MITTKLEKSAFYPGAVAVTTTSNSWRVMQPTTIVRTDFLLATGASGAGQTTVNIIKNGVSTAIQATASFDAGSGNSLSDATEFTLAEGDTLQIIVPEIAETPGSDLLVQFLYYPN